MQLFKRLIFLIVFLHTPLLMAEKILECMQPVFLDDPHFEQGSELFFDILWDDQKGVKVVLTKGTLETEVFLSEGLEERKALDLDDRHLSVEWLRPARISLVLRQFGSRWRGGFWFPEGHVTKLTRIHAGRDLELSCVEKGRLKSLK